LAWVGIDLHIHSVLSPCGDWSMSPKNIIERVKKMNIGVIAITDHHMVENYPAISFWGERMGVLVIPGMEIQTSEEVHIVSLFEDYDTALKFQKDIFNYLPDAKNREEIFGVQVVVNEKDEVERIEERLLNTSILLNVTDTVKKNKRIWWDNNISPCR
jgi:predicted metal-dependent phosphoesterase TrpH